MYILIWKGNPKQDLDPFVKKIVIYDEINVILSDGIFWQSREFYRSYDDAYLYAIKLLRYWDVTYWRIFELKDADGYPS